MHAAGEGRDRGDLIGDFRFATGFGKTLSRLVRHGIGVHHAGMLPKYRRLVEKLAQAGLLKVICGTDTLGVGVNVPIRTVLFTALSKYDGKRARVLHAREFHQIAGRAGRAGFDTAGRVVVQAPEHVIENEKALAKAGDDPKERRKVVRKKPPEGFVCWGQSTFERLVAADPEPLTSRFQVTHAMLLNVIARPGNAYRGDEHLLTDNHEDRRQAAQAHPPGHRDLPLAARRRGRRAARRARRVAGYVRLTVDLQHDFALNQPLSPFALAAFDLLDQESATYALDVVSVIESTLDDPRQMLSAQQYKARGEAVAAMKADGVEYEERMELLQDISYPKPLEDAARGRLRRLPARPPVGRRLPAVAQVRGPRHVRAGDDLRASTSPSTSWPGPRASCCATSPTPTRRWGRPCPTRRRPRSSPTSSSGSASSSGRSTPACSTSGSSSATPRRSAPRDAEAPTGQAGHANTRAFRVLVRNALFRRVELAALREVRRAGELDADDGWDADAWADAMDAYLDEYDDIGTGPDARGPELLLIEEGQDGLGGPPDLRRPGGRPRLGHFRRGGPGRLRRGGRRGHPRHGRRPALAVRLPVPGLTWDGFQVGEQQVAVLRVSDVPAAASAWSVCSRAGQFAGDRVRAGQRLVAEARSQSPMPFSRHKSRTRRA